MIFTDFLGILLVVFPASVSLILGVFSGLREIMFK